MTAPNHTIPLTAADCFMLALDQQHIAPSGLSSNTCHYLLELNGKFDTASFRQKLNAHADLQWLASAKPLKQFWFSLPVWKVGKRTIIPVIEHHTDELLPDSVTQNKITLDHSPLFRFDVLHRSTGNTAIVFSWNHLLMDGYGASLLLQQIASNGDWPRLNVSPTKQTTTKFNLFAAIRAKLFIDRTSAKPLASIAPDNRTASNQKIKIIGFSTDETKAIDQTGITLGAQFGRSPVYLVCTARGVQSILRQRNQPLHDFWIPMPRDQRKKGAQGPLIGNHLSFLFYRLQAKQLQSIRESIQSINNQMIEQVKNKTFADYDILMHALRRTPLPLYYYWIKGPQGGSLSSFLCTVAADHPDSFTHFQGQAITDAWSFPSNIHPPGLTFAFMRYRESLQVMISYFDDVITPTELIMLEQKLKHELITGTPFDA